MMFAVLMSLWNSKFFRKTMSTLHEFLPHIIILSCMFCYMACIMLHKWTAFTAGGFDGDIMTTEHCASSILITFINMVLFKVNKKGAIFIFNQWTDQLFLKIIHTSVEEQPKQMMSQKQCEGRKSDLVSRKICGFMPIWES